MRGTDVFWLNTEQTAIILSCVLHYMISNSTLFCDFLVRRFTVLSNINLKCDSANARDVRAVKHENSISSHMNDFLVNSTIW